MPSAATAVRDSGADPRANTSSSGLPNGSDAMPNSAKHSGDRTVHARYPGMEIVRYDRAGKWYLEPTDACARQAVTLAEAASAARRGLELDGQAFIGRPGGQTFDRKVYA